MKKNIEPYDLHVNDFGWNPNGWNLISIPVTANFIKKIPKTILMKHPSLITKRLVSSTAATMTSTTSARSIRTVNGETIGFMPSKTRTLWLNATAICMPTTCPPP